LGGDLIMIETQFFPVTSFADVFIFGGAYYGGDFGYFLPIPQGAAAARRRYIFIN
jgi:hypothetical protein